MKTWLAIMVTSTFVLAMVGGCVAPGSQDPGVEATPAFIVSITAVNEGQKSLKFWLNVSNDESHPVMIESIIPPLETRNWTFPIHDEAKFVINIKWYADGESLGPSGMPAFYDNFTSTRRHGVDGRNCDSGETFTITSSGNYTYNEVPALRPVTYHGLSTDTDFSGCGSG